LVFKEGDISYELKGFKFVWDKVKSENNFKKHKITFEEAAEVFTYDKTKYIPDIEHSSSEDREIAIGFSFSMAVLVVCHCLREEDTVYRIFSARKANRVEYAEFGEWLNENNL